MTTSSATFFVPPQRPGSNWFVDMDGVQSTYKFPDDVLNYSINWSDILDSGETVSSVAYATSGPTTSNAALASNVSSVDVTGTGSLNVTATTSSSRTVTQRVRFYDERSGRPLVDDYSGC